MKFCEDCKWVRPDMSQPENSYKRLDLARCHHPKIAAGDALVSDSMMGSQYCSHQRVGSWLSVFLGGGCGRMGRFWEVKELADRGL